MRIGINLQDGLRIEYMGRQLEPHDIAAAWYRKPFVHGNSATSRSSLEQQQKHIQYSLWHAIPEKAWLNPPGRILHAEHKLTQLLAARQIGFTIPETVVANQWEPIQHSLPHSVIFKLPRAMVEVDGREQIVPTTPFINSPSSLPKNSNPFPGLWQPRLIKKREWRVVVVGDRLFAGAIYTKAAAKEDWRIHFFTDAVKIRKASFPADQQALCFSYLEKLGLKFGVFDFIEDTDGKIIFLECNHNGEYGELANDLRLPITEAIVDELDRIATA
ncbi:MAG TPA: hypothetical protein VK694_04550 [Verrucomicrobiae bacterium]|nr:hypothetical protein [Verrucomicrobiae bacterium]